MTGIVDFSDQALAQFKAKSLSPHPPMGPWKDIEGYGNWHTEVHAVWADPKHLINPRLKCLRSIEGRSEANEDVKDELGRLEFQEDGVDANPVRVIITTKNCCVEMNKLWDMLPDGKKQKESLERNDRIAGGRRPTKGVARWMEDIDTVVPVDHAQQAAEVNAIATTADQEAKAKAEA